MGVIRIPGMLDPHVHLRGMEWSHKGTFASETAAALAGGYPAVLDMPNTPPATISRDALDRKRAEIGAQAHCDWGLYFGASQDDNSGAFAGAAPDTCGLKIYCNATTGSLLVADPALRDRLFAAWPRSRVIAVHAEGRTVAEILTLVRAHRRAVHFCHISTAEEIDLLRAAKADGLPVSLGVCPHHLYLTEDDLPAIGWRGLMKPGLKTRADRDALWQAVAEGLVDVIESDHAPHTIAEKASGTPHYGVPGLETTLPLLLLAVREGRVSLNQAIGMVSSAPRRIFSIPLHADTYTVIDADQRYEIRDADLLTAARWSPYAGMQVVGRVLEVWVRGRRAYHHERGVESMPGSGRCLLAEPV